LKNYVVFVFFLLSVSADCLSQSAICAYKYRKRITFDPARVSGPSDLAAFPVLIDIATDNDLRTVANGGHVENANGFDIVFTGDDGVTFLNFQLEKFTATTGQLTVWVNLPILSTSIETDIYMYYGNTAIGSDQSSTAVWTNYHGAWHLENGSFSDNSPSGYNFTNNGTTNQSPAFISDGRANNGTQWLESATFPNMTTNFSMSAWIYTTDNTRAGQRIFCDDVNNSGGYALSIGDNGAGSLRFFSRSSNPVVLDTPNNTILNNTWYYVTAVADITNLVKRIYINGVQIVSSAYTNAWGTDAGNASAAGETAAGETANRLAGRIDEVRVSKFATTADWSLTEYNNQNSPATFYAISVEPKIWAGGTSTNYNTVTNWLNSAPPNSGDDVLINNGSNQPTLQGNEQVNSIFIRTGATLNMSNRRLSVRSDISNCGTINGGTGEVRLNGSNAFVQNQNLSGSGVYNFNDLTINNTFATNPSVILGKDVSITGALALTSGIVYSSSTNILSLSTGATSSSGSATSFVSGPISKTGNTDFIFPTGKGTRWRRASVTNITASSTFVGEYFNTAFTSTTPVNSPLNNISTTEYWQVSRTGAGNANLSLHWEDASASGIDNCADLTIARWNGASWDERPATTVGGSSCAGTGTGRLITNAALTAFSPFTFGSKANGINPLPVQLLEFTAACNNSKVLLAWSTASEKDNDHFVLERSEDGTNWLEISKVKGSGTVFSLKNYSFVDDYRADKVVYYRLSQVDANGEKEQFEIITADCKSNENQVNMYPNPAINELTLDLTLSQNYGERSIKIIDNLGRICQQENLNLMKGESVYKIALFLLPGSYTIVFVSDNLNLLRKKLIIR